MTKPPLTDVPIRSAEELTAHWTALLDPPIFGTRALWLMWLRADGLPLPVLLPIDDMPRLPDHSLLSGLLAVHDGIAAGHLDGGGHLALALCRPGPPEISEDDDGWVDALSDMLDDSIDATWSLHLAAGGSVQPLIDLPA